MVTWVGGPEVPPSGRGSKSHNVVVGLANCFPFSASTVSSVWVRMIDRIVADIFVEIELVGVPHRIGLQEPAERRRVDPGLVVVHAERGEPHLAGIAEPSGIGRGGEAGFVR